jgi:hypothetical protein
MPERWAPTTATRTEGLRVDPSAWNTGSGGQWPAGGALGQAGGMVETLAQFGQLPVAAAAADQGDAKRQSVGRRLLGTDRAA